LCLEGNPAQPGTPRKRKRRAPSKAHAVTMNFRTLRRLARIASAKMPTRRNKRGALIFQGEWSRTAETRNSSRAAIGSRSR
jgi:hypothetical protein